MINQLKKFFGVSSERRKMEPEGYIVQASEWPEQVNKRITQSVSSTAQKGVSGIEITANHPESITERAAREIKNFQEQEEIKVNLHATMQLRTAMAEQNSYERVEEYMKGYIRKADDIGADYVNLHTSAFPSPEIGRSRGVRYEVMVTPEGEPIKNFIKQLANKNPDSKTFEWLVKEFDKIKLVSRWEIIEVITDDRNDYFEKLISEDEILNAKENIKRSIEAAGNERAPEVSREEAIEKIKAEYSRSNKIVKKFRDMDEDYRVEVLKQAAQSVLEEKGDVLFEERRVMNEFRVYKLIGWWMYENGHSIWRKICGRRSPEELKDEGEMKLLVDAVAGRYIEGHIEHWKDLLDKTGVTITLETPDARNPEFLGHYRLVDPTRIYHVISAIDHPNVRLCFDFEHIATHGINVNEVLGNAPRNLGDFTYLVHLSSNPSPGHEHFPLQKGEKGLYEMLWTLKTKGFNSGYLTIERGGGQGGGGQQDEIWKRSISIVKDMAMYLEDDVSPNDLPIEFFGYDDKEFKRDRATIRSNTFKPIQGLIESPELEDTLLGKHATESEPRMRGGGWKSEEHQ